ncbi:MAG: hypothetical protein ACE5MK_09470 [Acidobacteriota bacterium]
MSRWERWLLNLSTLVVSGTGVVYFGMKYVMESDDPFSVVNHPWQPLMLDLHILSSPILIFVLGIIISSHIAKKLRNNNKNNNKLEGRRSGLIALLSFPPMVISGYLLQTMANPLLLRLALIVHLVTGVMFAGCYLIHLIIGIRLRQAHSTCRKETRLAA